MKHRVIETFRHEYPVALMANLLGVSRSGIYHARRRPISTREHRDRQLKPTIEAVFKRHKKRYGSPRVYRELRDAGEQCHRHQVARLMRQMGLRAVYRNRHTPRINRAVQLNTAAPNLVARCFEVAEPNRVWLGDITQLPTREGWVYLATNMDMYSRRIVGWSISTRYDVELVIDALARAQRARCPDSGLVVHTDQGSQYRAGGYRAYLNEHGMVPSMSRKGDCWDNAPMESFFKSLKTEIGQTNGWRMSQTAARLENYIEEYYNPERLHSGIGYMSPIRYEQRSGAI